MSRSRITLRTGDSSQVPMLHELITASLEEGHLLARSLGEIAAHAERFVVAVRGRTVVGCADLAPLSPQVAEVRSLAVRRAERGSGVGTLLVDELHRRAHRAGYEKLCAFTHAAGYFVQRGFSIVPHLWLPEKIFVDCVRCPRFRQCGQYAMVLPLDDLQDSVDGSRREIHGDAAQPGSCA